jgi:site-specific DNA-cytosine methylase
MGHTDLTADTIPTLDRFAGAGGLSLGFEQADLGFLPVFAVEHDEVDPFPLTP